MEFRDIIYTEVAGIATITINRPEVRNAFNDGVIAERYAGYAIERGKLSVDVASTVLLLMGLALLPAHSPRESPPWRKLRDALLAWQVRYNTQRPLAELLATARQIVGELPQVESCSVVPGTADASPGDPAHDGHTHAS